MKEVKVQLSNIEGRDLKIVAANCGLSQKLFAKNAVMVAVNSAMDRLIKKARP